jgi:hypothetical protein
VAWDNHVQFKNLSVWCGYIVPKSFFFLKLDKIREWLKLFAEGYVLSIVFRFVLKVKEEA